MLGSRVRPAVRSTAEPSTLMRTSSVPMPAPVITSPAATSGTDLTMSATAMSVIATATTPSAPVSARRAPSQCRSGVDPSSPPMAPTVTPASSSPIVAVSMPSSVLMAGSRGPQAESEIPPRANAAVIAQRQRASVRPVGCGHGIAVHGASVQKPSAGRYHAGGYIPISVKVLDHVWPAALRGQQTVQDRQRAADVDRVRIEQPLDLQPVGRGDHQRGRVHRVDASAPPAPRSPPAPAPPRSARPAPPAATGTGRARIPASGRAVPAAHRW